MTDYLRNVDFSLVYSPPPELRAEPPSEPPETPKEEQDSFLWRALQRGIPTIQSGLATITEDAPSILAETAALFTPNQTQANLIRNLGKVGSKSETYRQLTGDAVRETRESAAARMNELGPREFGSVFEEEGLGRKIGSLAETVAESALPTLGGIATGAITRNPTAAGAVMFGGTAPMTYGGIRERQQAEGIDDVGRAALGTAVSSSLDLLTGVGGKVLSATGLLAAREAIEGGMRQAATRVLTTAGEESGTEILQNVIEQVAGGSDPTTKQAMLETLEAGLAGAFGGAVFGGGIEVATAPFRPEPTSRENADRSSQDTDLLGALEVYRQQGGQRLLESPETIVLRDLAADDTPIRAGGLNLTPAQLYEFAENNTANPRIAEIMAQPASPAEKASQVARVLNAAEADRVEARTVEQVSGLVGPTQSVTSSKQMIGNLLDGIGPEVVAESQTLTAIRNLVDQPQKGQRFVTGIRDIVGNYTPTTREGESLVARPERGGEGSVIMGQTQVAEEAQREREADQAFRLSQLRQERFDRATGTTRQREDLRAGAPEPETQFFLGENYGDLAGTPVEIVQAASPETVRLQYESPTETDASGRPVTISEEVSIFDIAGRVIRGTNRMTQDLAANLRAPKAGVGTDMDPRRSVDRTRTRAVSTTEEAGPPAIQPNLVNEGYRARPTTDVAPQSAQETPAQENIPLPQGVQSTPDQAPDQAQQLPAPPQGLPAPARALPAPNAPEQEGTTPEVQDQEASVPEREAADEEIDIDSDPRMVELNDRFDAAIERVQETENTREARKLAKALIKEGVIDEDAYVDIDEAIKDETDRDFKHDTAMAAIEDAIETRRDNAAADLESEILDETDAGDTRFSGRTSKRKKRVRPTGAARPAEQTTEQTTDQTAARERPAARQEPVKSELAKAEQIINDRLDKIAGDGEQGARIAQRLRGLLDDRLITVPQLYAAFEGGKIASQILPKNANVDVVWVPILRADSERAAVASGTAAGQEAAGSYDVFDVSQDGLSGIIRLSLSDNVSDFAQENAAHEAFHVIQDMLEIYDPAAFNLINSSFRDGGRVDDFPASILRKLKTLTVDGNQSVYQSLKASFGDNTFSFYEAQAVAFGALVDAKNRGENMKGLPASFIRIVDFAATLFRDMGKALRLVGDSPAEIFDTFRTGQAQANLTQAAPTASDLSRSRFEALLEGRYSARTKPVASATGKGVSEGNVLGFEPDLRVKVSGVTMPPKSPILASTNNKNAARQIAELDGILDAYPNAGVDANEWAGMMSYAFKSQEVPVPPYRFIKEVTGNGSVENLQRLTQGQIDDASHGFDNAREFRRAYTNGELSEVTTGKLFLWSFLSRGISPYAQEAMFIDSFSGIDKYIRLAADGKFDESTVKEYLDWAKTIAPAGSGQAGAGAKSNLNSFGQDFLLKMGRRGDDGKSHLRRLHEMLEDPDMTGRQIRREFATFGEGVGIDNKVVSFTLLVVGFNDVMVLDRVQIRQLWDDGRFKDRNLYDGRKVDGKVVTGSALAPIGEGVRGILVYEAIERALDAQVSNIYSAIGRPQDASIGRFHWETWVADSQQEASHGTLDAILKDAKGDDYAIARVTAKQGEYGAYEYGARYGVDNQNNPYYIYSTPDGGLYKFDVPSYRQFLGAIKKKGKNGVVPTGFSVQKAGNQPWYNQPEVNREKIRELAGQYGTEVQPERRGASAVRGADANQDAADGAGPDTVRYSGRTASPAQIADRIRSRFPSTPRVEGGPAREGNVGRRRGGVLADDLTGRVPVKSTYSHSEGVKAAYAELGVATPDFHELTGGRASAALYSRLINEAKVDNRFGASVYVYPTEEYTDMRLFLSGDGTAGFALKGDDIVSAFKAGNSPHRAVAYSMVRIGVALGGRRLDAFDTVLPSIYSVSGFRATSRLRWSDEAMDDVMRREWSKETFAAFNNGEPDVVFMAYDENREGVYEPDEGEYADDYDTAVAMQTAAVSGQRLSGRTRNNAGIDQSIIDKVTSEEPKAGVFGKFLDKMVGRVGNESRRRALVRNTTKNADGMFELDRMLDAAIRGVDPADGRVPVDGSSVGRIMEMMAHSNGVLQAALELGPPVFDGELTTISDDISGLFDIFAPIGESRADAFQTYAVARRESDLRRRGRVGFTELTDAEIAKTLSGADPDFAEVFQRYQEFNGAIIDYAIDTGYLSEELGEKFKDMDYIPYYRAYEQDDGSLDVLGPKMQAAINNPKSGLDLKLKGGKSNLGNLYENIIRNTQSIISAARKNLALQEAADAVDALNELGIDDIGRRVKTPEGEGIMRLRVEGKPVYYKIEDPAVWFAIAGLGPQQLSWLQSVIRPFTNVLRMSITMPASFMMANLWRGKISAYVTTDANLSLGLDTLKGMKDAFQSGEATKIIKANTGMGGYDYGMGEKDFANEIRRRYRRTEGNYNSFTQNAFDSFKGFIALAEKFGEASEFAERVKLYNDIIANGGSPKTAAYEAMNLTNFGRKGAGQGYLGATLKYLIPIVPFLNARIQGLYRIAENQQNEETILGLRKKVLFRGLLYTAISSAIYAAMSDDDRWDEETVEAKMLYDIIYIGDMRFTLPRPFEVGTIFGSLPIAMYDYVRDRDGKEAARKLRFAFVNTFAFNPIPPAVLTAGEVTANYSVFRSGPIDNMADMNLPAGMRYDERTSEVSKAIGGAIDVSPKKLDYLVNGYLGPMGAGFLSGIDSVLSGVGVIPKKAGGLFGDPYHIADTIASASGITRFVKDSDRATSRFVRDFYELKKEADQANRARKKLIEEGRNEEALEFAEEMKFPLRARKQLGRIAREISKVNKQIDLIEVDPKLTPAEKQLKLKPLLKKRKALARSGYDYARGMRTPVPENDYEVEAEQ